MDDNMNVCRVCMAREGAYSVKLVNIFDIKTGAVAPEDEIGIGNVRLDDILYECSNCEVKLDDPLPKKICLRCVIDAQHAFKFKRLCNHSYRFLCQLLNERQKSSTVLVCQGESPIRIQKSSSEAVAHDKPEHIEISPFKREADENREAYADLRNEDRLELSGMDLGPVKIEQELSSDCQETQQEELSYCTDEHGVKDTHRSDDRPFKCPHCPKTFAQNQHLKRHISGHMGKRPYKCTHCPKDFAQSHHLKRHDCTHTGQPFKCPHCSKAFPLNHLLADHIRVHTGERPFQCPHCPKSFTQNPYLTAHIRRHRGERPFQCPYCPKAFGLNHILQTHIRGHKGDRPHKCAHCLKSFTQKCNLKMHERRCPAIIISQTTIAGSSNNCSADIIV